jgi:hypothetical protein
MRLVGLIVTVGTLAAIYFFVIKPISDTTSDTVKSFAPVFESVQDAQKQAAEAQQAANEAAKTSGNPGSKKQAKDLNSCLSKAGSDVNRITNCLAESN